MASPEIVAKIMQMEAENDVLTPESPGEWAGKEGKHVPQLAVEDGKAVVVVPHGMDEEHFIPFVYITNSSGELVAAVEFEQSESTLASLENASLEAEGLSGELTPFAYCNKHGLWQGTAVSA